MSEIINLQKRVVNLQQFNNVVDSSFSTFTKEYYGIPPEGLENSLEKFFQDYERVYYEIPIKGEINSHEFLVKRSSELAGFEVETEEIGKLLEEIESLRVQLIQAYTTIEELSK